MDIRDLKYKYLTTVMYIRHSITTVHNQNYCIHNWIMDIHNLQLSVRNVDAWKAKSD